MRENLIDENKYRLNDIVDRTAYNKSVYFILPMIGLDSKYFSLINCYLGDSNYPEYSFNKILMNCKYNDEKLRAYKYYNTEYKLDNKTWMYVFDIPEHFNNDYVLFCQGKYSEFSNEYKQQITKFLSKPIQNQQVYKILFKTADRKAYIENLVGESIGNQEVMSKPNLESELFTKERLYAK